MLQDIRFALRTLFRAPGFLAVAVLTLALGIGANTAVFGVVKAVLLARLPYPQPDRLVQLWESRKDGGLVWVSTPNFLDWQAQNRSLESLAYYGTDTVVVSGSVSPAHVRLAEVSRDFFRTLAVSPEIGRGLQPADHVVGAGGVVVLSQGIWRRAFAGDPNVIGRIVKIYGAPFTITGVMPDGFNFPERSEVWIAREREPDTSTRSAHNHRVIARLKPGLSLRAAQADLDTVAARLGAQYIDDKERGIRALGLYDAIVGPVRPALLILLGAVCFVLLIACVNIANLQLARGSTRVREMALRSALGAVRARLIRQLLTESTLIALAGGLAGFLVALWGTEFLRVAVPRSIPRVENIHVDLSVLLFTLGASLAAGILFGIIPALSASHTNVNEALKEGSGKATLSTSHRRLGSALVMAEIAIATILLAGAGLLIRTFYNLEQVQPGFATAGVFTSEVSWPVGPCAWCAAGQGDADLPSLLTGRLLERVRAIPGIASAGAINSFPIKESGSDGGFEIAGRPLPSDPHQIPDSWYRVTTTGYFETMDIPLRRGRLFNAADERPGTPQVAIVNESFAREFFPHSEALGHRIRFLGFDRQPQFMQIVGIVKDVRSVTLTGASGSELFVDGFQHPGELSSPTLVVRGPFTAMPAIRAAVTSIDANVPVEFTTVRALLDESVSRQRFQMMLLAIFAALALILAAVGIYGVQSYTVTRRTSELGIRLALGADRDDLLRLVLREGAVTAGAGLAAGILGALILTRTLSALLFNVSPADPLTYFAIVVVLGVVALLACFLPARRASHTNPMTALRYE